MRFSTCGSQFHTYLNIYESVDDSDDDMYYYMMYMYSSSSHTCGSITEYPAGTNWQDAVDFCEETGMGLIASRDDTDWVGSCEYNSNTSNMEWYTYPRAVDISVSVEQGRTYWISVTGARDDGARNGLSWVGALSCVASIRAVVAASHPQAPAAARGCPKSSTAGTT